MDTFPAVIAPYYKGFAWIEIHCPFCPEVRLSFGATLGPKLELRTVACCYAATPFWTAYPVLAGSLSPTIMALPDPQSSALRSGSRSHALLTVCQVSCLLCRGKSSRSYSSWSSFYFSTPVSGVSSLMMLSSLWTLFFA